MSDYGRLFKAVREIFRFFSTPYRIVRTREITEPSVLICRHDNLNGPRIVLTWLPDHVRTWVFHVFMDKDSCYKHYVNYTFSKRFGWSNLKTRVTAKALTPLVVNILDSMGAIAVYRDSLESFKTIKETLKALQGGNSILIFPDVNYTSTDKEDRGVYEGFIYLERYYHKRTGKHLPFVPIFLNHEKKEIHLGESIYFTEGIDFYKQKDRVLDLIVNAINQA